MFSRSQWVRLALATLFAGVMAFLALRPSPYLQYIPWMPRSLGVWADHHGILRNTAGFFVFALAVFLLVGRRAVHVIALCVFATLIEVAQIWIPSRRFDWKDIVASVAGIFLGWAVAWLGAAGLRRRRAARI